MSFLRAFPLLILPVLFYNVMVVTTGSLGGSSDVMTADLAHAVGHFAMPVSNAAWAIQMGDIILFIGLIALFFEVVASSGSSNDVLMKHVLAMLLFVICLVEFLLLKPFATSTFFLLMVMALLETIAGFIITTVAARKDIGMAH